MNRCTAWAICPLGDLSKAVGCRRPECPKHTAADVGSPLLFYGDRLPSDGPLPAGE